MKQGFKCLSARAVSTMSHDARLVLTRYWYDKMPVLVARLNILFSLKLVKVVISIKYKTFDKII